MSAAIANAPVSAEPSTRFICADVIAGLRQVETDSVHCVITSPPYWGLRNYGIEPSIWDRATSSCQHEWGERQRGPRGDLLPFGESTAGRIGTRDVQNQTNDGGQFCTWCNAWRGCLGLEPSPELFIEHIVEIFQHVRRTLHPRGTLWLNFGDCFITAPHGDGHTFDPKYGGRNRKEGYTANRLGGKDSGLKSKDLVMMPARIALALQMDGWYLRQQIPWLKKNGMPESCVDRPASHVEYIYLLSKSEDYFYDRAAVMAPQAEHERTRRLREQAAGLKTVYALHRDREHGQVKPGASGCAKTVAARQALAQTGLRGRRNTDWFFESCRGFLADSGGDVLAMLVNPQPFAMEHCNHCAKNYTMREFRTLHLNESTNFRICGFCGASDWLSHFATFPEAMVEPCLLAGTSELGACHHCGAPYERIVDKPGLGDWNADPSHKRDRGARASIKREGKVAPGQSTANSLRSRLGTPGNHGAPILSKGWRPTCSHPLFPSSIERCVVLDPFGGSGTTAVVAERHGRNAILIDRNAAYLDMARFRLLNRKEERTC